MKGIVLAGGSGSRLHPLTLSISKQLMPVYNKPMIYYPLSTLIMTGIRDILIISTPQDMPLFRKLLGDGSHLGCRFEYAVQPAPEGIAQAFTIGEDFIRGEKAALILGDNIFYGTTLQEKLWNAARNPGATIFAYHVNDPERYGVVHFDEHGKAVSIEEKPQNPQSNYAIPGIYFYDEKVADFARRLKPGARGEYEITDLNNMYLSRGELQVEILDSGIAWLDTGTFRSLSQAAQFVQVIEERQGLMIGSIEEAAYRAGFIDRKQLHHIASRYTKSGYGHYLMNI